MAPAHEVLVPAHSAVRRGLPRLARQRRAMDHHHRHVAVAALRHHVAHVHLVDGDVPAGAEVAQLALRLFDLLATDEEAALGLQHQRLVRRLHILECLRLDIDDRAEHAREGSTDENRRAARPFRDVTD